VTTVGAGLTVVFSQADRVATASSAAQRVVIFMVVSFYKVSHAMWQAAELRFFVAHALSREHGQSTHNNHPHLYDNAHCSILRGDFANLKKDD
jgi:hypothetical protein